MTHENKFLADVKFHPHSFSDQNIRLFNLDGQIYRGIRGEAAIFLGRLFKEGVIQSLVEKGLLIDSELTAFKLENYDLVVRHRSIPFNAYPNEWCAAMLKDGMILMLDLAIELAAYGLTLIDAHPWNVMFDLDQNRPIFIDLGSIAPISVSGWTAYGEFCRFCLYPLILMTNGYDEIARLLMFESQGVTESDVVKLVRYSYLGGDTTSIFNLLKSKIPQSIKNIFSLYLRGLERAILSLDADSKDKNKSHLKFLQNLREEVNNIKIDRKSKKICQLSYPSLLPNEWDQKQQIISRTLAELKPSSVLDISVQTGWQTQLAVLSGSQVLSFDQDPDQATMLYYDACEKRTPIFPLVMDFTKSTPARGLGNYWSIAANERLSCDMVLALGIVYHLVRVRCLSFEHIVEGLALFAKKWVLVEFMQEEEQQLDQGYAKDASWYTIDNFIRALKQRFQQVKILPCAIPKQVLLLCEK
jgi:hypothetical protein